MTGTAAPRMPKKAVVIPAIDEQLRLSFGAGQSICSTRIVGNESQWFGT